MHNPYKTKQALLAASFVAVSSLAACNSNSNFGPGGEAQPTVNPAPPPQPESVQTSNMRSEEPEVDVVPTGPSVNPAPPVSPPQ